MKIDSLPAAIFFDMDGLLVDTEPLWLESESELLAEFGISWREEDQLYCLGGPLEKVGLYMAKLTGNRATPEWFIIEIIRKVHEKFVNLELMPGVAALLAQAKELGIPIALVSASPRNLVDKVLGGLAEPYFALSISSEDVLLTKPNPEPYLLAAKELQVAISNSLILEDSSTGVEAARASGAFVIAVPNLAPISPAPRSAIVPSLVGFSIENLWSLARA